MGLSVRVLVVMVAVSGVAIGNPEAAPDSSCAGITNPEEFVVRLSRPMKEGDVYEISTVVRRELDGACASKDSSGKMTFKLNQSWRVEGTVELLAVDDKGRGTRLKLRMTRCLLAEDGREVDLVARKRVCDEITIESDAKGRITSMKCKERRDVLPEVVEIIKAAVNVFNFGGPTEDEALGMVGKRRVGSSWAVNQAVAKECIGNKTGAAVEHLKGTVTLKELSKRDGVECVTVAAEMNFSTIPVLTGWLPTEFPTFRGFQPGESSCKLSIIRLVPTDLSVPALPRIESTLEGRMSFRILPQPGSDEKEQSGKATFKLVCREDIKAVTSAGGRAE